MKKVYIIRHGETEYNVQKRYQGQIDISLNENGKKQAREAQDKIKHLDIGLIYVSPSKRTKETAEIINLNNIPIIEDKAFLERNLGVYEGLVRDEAKTKYPDLWNADITKQYKGAPTGGETIEDVEIRVFAKMDEIASSINTNILIVTHKFTSKMIHKYFNQSIIDEEFHSLIIENAEIKEYEFGKDR